MNFKKFLPLLVSLVLGVILFSACSNASAARNFPTGKFEKEGDQWIYYRFNADKTWSYHYYGDVGAQGNYRVKGNQWIEKGTDECPFPGTYQWSFDGSRLTFKLVGEDKCEPRREATDGQTFVLAK